MLALLLLTAAISSLVLADYPYGTWDNQYGNETLSCNSTIDRANASAIFSFPVNYPLATNGTPQYGDVVQNVPNPAWAITVDKLENTTQQTLWFDTAGQDYSDDLALEYDVCAFILTGLPRNTIALGQNDPGDCSSMLSSPCRDEILSRIAESAQKWTAYYSPPPYSNLSAGVLPTLCSYIMSDLGEDGKDYPRTCAKEFGYSYNVKDIEAYNRLVYTESVALTGYNETILDSTACTLQGDGRNFQPVRTTFSETSKAYDEYTREVIPVMATWFTVANAERTGGTSWANSTMTCVKAEQFSEGSRVSPALPDGTPYDYSKGVSGGAIAGIVVGVVVLVAVFAGIGLWMWRRRVRRRNLASDKAKGAEAEGTGLSEFGGDDVHELKWQDRKLEKDSSTISEMDDGSGAKELQGDSRTAELKQDTKPAELSA